MLLLANARHSPRMTPKLPLRFTGPWPFILQISKNKGATRVKALLRLTPLLSPTGTSPTARPVDQELISNLSKDIKSNEAGEIDNPLPLAPVFWLTHDH